MRICILVLMCFLASEAFALPTITNVQNASNTGDSVGSTGVAGGDVDTPAGQPATEANIPGATGTPTSIVKSSSFPTLDIISLSKLGMESTDLGNLGADTNSTAALQRIALSLADPGVARGVNDALVDTRAKTSLVLATRQQMFQLMPMLGANQEVLNRYLECESKNIQEQNMNAFDVVRFCMKQIAPAAVSAGGATVNTAPSEAEAKTEAVVVKMQADIAAKIPKDYKCSIDDFEIESEKKTSLLSQFPWLKAANGIRASYALSQTTNKLVGPMGNVAVTSSTPLQQVFTDYVGDTCVIIDPLGSQIGYMSAKITRPPQLDGLKERYMRGVYDNLIALMKGKCLKELGEPANEGTAFRKDKLFPSTTIEQYRLTTDAPTQFWNSKWVNDAWLQRMSFTGFKFGPEAGNALYKEITLKAKLEIQHDWTTADTACDAAFSIYSGKFDDFLAAQRLVDNSKVSDFPKEAQVLMKAVSIIAQGRMSSFLLEMLAQVGGLDFGADTRMADYRRYLIDAIAYRARQVGILGFAESIDGLPDAHGTYVSSINSLIEKIALAQSRSTGTAADAFGVHATEAKSDPELTLPY